MRAVTWQGRRDVRVEDVPDPIIKEPTDAIIKVTSSGLCGSDLHLNGWEVHKVRIFGRWRSSIFASP